MEFLKTHLEQIRHHLGHMSISAKIAAILLAVVVALSLAWIISAAARPQRVAVMDAPLTGQELLAAEQAIRRQGIDVEVADGMLMVPADRQQSARIALIAENISGPVGGSDLIQEALKASPFQTRDQSDRIWAHVEQTKMSQLISQFNGVKRAQVVLKPGSPQGIGRRYVAPTASVHLVMQTGRQTTPKLRRAIADLVCGGVSSLKPSDVRIVDSTNGRSFRGGDEFGSSDEDLEAMQLWQDHCVRNVRDALGDIPDVLVAVFPIPDTTTSVKTDTVRYDEPVAVRTDSASAMAMSTGGAPAEPGVGANTSARLPAVGGSQSSSEKSQSAFEPRFGTTHIVRSEGPALGLKDVSVSVTVPLSYLVRVFQKMPGNDEASEPSAADLTGLLARIRERVRPALPIREDNQLNVDWYVDFEPPSMVETAQAGVMPTLVTNGKTLALGALALVALVMVMMFARRRAPEPPGFDSRFNIEGLLDTTVGAVDGSEGALEGIELDEDTVRSQRVVEQVGEMVRERPDSAANLVRRWVEKG